MKTVGVVAEYNPFHNGHILQIREIRRRFPDAGIVVAMSGCFTRTFDTPKPRKPHSGYIFCANQFFVYCIIA